MYHFMMFQKLRLLLTLLMFITTLLFSLSGNAEINQLFNTSQTASSQQFIPVEEAFQVDGKFQEGKATIEFTVTPGHYLYRDRFSFKPVDGKTTLGEPSFPKGIEKYDYNFEKNLEVYPEDMSVSMPAQTSSSVPEIEVRFQGCADAGLCYPPHTVRIPLVSQTPAQSAAPVQGIESSLPAESTDVFKQETDYQETLLDKGLLTALALFLLAGIGLTFTPCVLPMIPILSSILVGSSTAKSSRTMALTFAYVLSMSATFALAGTLMGLFGASLNLQAKLQSPWLLVPFSLLFVILALSMFGLYELQLPQKIRDRLGNVGQQGGSLTNTAIMGALSALVVSPCVSAPLAGALIYIGTTGDAIYGGLSLFALGLGMGIPLLVIGIGGRQLLPKAGSWMDSVKQFFGFMLLAVAIWMLERIIPGPASLALWGALLTAAAVQLGALDFSRKQGYPAFFQALGLLLLVYGVCLIVGAAKGNSNPLQPLAPAVGLQQAGKTAASPQFLKLSSVAELSSQLKMAAAAKKIVMVDVYADWCISCKIMERDVFPSPQVAPMLTELTLLKLDITENTREHQDWLSHYQLFGPPALVFFDESGQELRNLRALGEITAPALAEKLRSFRPSS